LRTLDQALTDAFSNNKRELQRLQQRGVLVPNSIDNLDEKDPFIMASQNLKISSTIPYHSIIAQYNANKRWSKAAMAWYRIPVPICRMLSQRKSSPLGTVCKRIRRQYWRYAAFCMKTCARSDASGL
jgi:hypothetical protein